MTTKVPALENLITAAAAADNDEAVLKLLDHLDDVEPQTLKDSAANFETLFEAWGETVGTSNDKSNLCLILAENSILDSQNFRNALYDAVKKLLPPYISSPSVIKAIGARDTGVSVRDAALRLRKLQHLRSTALVYMNDTHSWGKINNIDKVTATIAVNSLNSVSVSSVPIASAVLSSYFFDLTPDMLNLLYPGKTSYKSAAEYRRIFLKNSLAEISESKVSDIVMRLMVPEIMSPDTFEAWWTAKDTTAIPAGQRAFWDARSVLELHSLLKPLGESGGGVRVTAEAAEKIEKLFGRLRAEMTPKDIEMLAECISYLSEANDVPVLTKMFMPLRGKASFWPTEISIEKTNLKSLETWGKLSVKLLGGFIKATALLYTQKELAELSIVLPLRCVTVLYEILPLEAASEVILKHKLLSSDILLWIWKNRHKIPAILTSILDMEKIITALSIENLPKEWTAAQRELKKQLFEKQDFQKFVIENADGDIPSIINALQKYRNFQPGERQSIMVKLSRSSEDLKSYLESGEGKKMMGVKASAENAVVQKPPMTSVVSHKRLMDELDNLIRVLIPENAAAVALARSFGDLRENAEYDAAKERRRFLHRRRAELEATLSFIQGTDFKDIKVQNHVVLGCQVKLESAAGKKREYYILGAWDGDPEKNRISYRTKIGEALMDKQIGDKVEIPEEGSFTIKELFPLPEELRKELAGE